MTTENCVQIETRTDNRSEIYYVNMCQNILYCTNLNRREEFFLAVPFTVENSQCNEFTIVADVKSKVK